MTLLIKQLIIRGEVVEDSERSNRGEKMDYEAIRQLVESAKREIVKECQERISEMIENSVAR
ncbi:hypothetical protein J0A67_03130 [Algoriphagus aestuariicola]|jgi:hypothetical protein|uniref:Uncharacterized protein n=1 Tax=Algoriphagus aestuariicola TaxID=1852016 RepID=A0ABS3BLW9_9BACT|nr:DUF5908 family protein [Algoriphagus aestuariicola]MBN7799834.1 hypothetical protein [Algoriphagus aestuariicola]